MPPATQSSPWRSTSGLGWTLGVAPVSTRDMGFTDRLARLRVLWKQRPVESRFSRRHHERCPFRKPRKNESKEKYLRAMLRAFAGYDAEHLHRDFERAEHKFRKLEEQSKQPVFKCMFGPANLWETWAETRFYVRAGDGRAAHQRATWSPKRKVWPTTELTGILRTHRLQAKARSKEVRTLLKAAELDIITGRAFLSLQSPRLPQRKSAR